MTDTIQEALTRKDATELFISQGNSLSTFERRVREGDIIPFVRNGVKLYPRAQILAAVRTEGQGKKRKRVTSPPLRTVTFTQATPENMPELAMLMAQIFDGSPHIARWQALIEKNPTIGFMLREQETDTPVGCAYIFPHTEKKIKEILDHTVTPVTAVEDILLYEEGTHVHLYLRTIGITPLATKREKRHWAMIMIRNLSLFIEHLGRQGVIIDKIWSRSETPDGINILQHIGFTRIKSKTPYRNYVIDVPTSGLPLCEKYEYAYQQYLQYQSGEVG